MRKGEVMPEELRLKISLAQKGQKRGPAWNKGLSMGPHTEEWKEKRRGQIAWNKG